MENILLTIAVVAVGIATAFNTLSILNLHKILGVLQTNMIFQIDALERLVGKP